MAARVPPGSLAYHHSPLTRHHTRGSQSMTNLANIILRSPVSPPPGPPAQSPSPEPIVSDMMIFGSSVIKTETDKNTLQYRIHLRQNSNASLVLQRLVALDPKKALDMKCTLDPNQILVTAATPDCVASPSSDGKSEGNQADPHEALSNLRAKVHEAVRVFRRLHDKPANE